MPDFFRDHILLGEHTQSLPYTAINLGRGVVAPRRNIDRIEQGARVRESFDDAVQSFVLGAPSNEFVYIEFQSVPGFFLDIDKFDKRNYRLASYKKLNNDPEEPTYQATVYLNRAGIADFLRKAEQYIGENTIGGNPKHQNLIANLDQIRAATLESFWQEPELPFPRYNQSVWWEIWLTRDPLESDDAQLRPIFNLLTAREMQVGTSRWLSFPENMVFLVKGTAAQLGSSILYTDTLAELRKPRETAEYFTYLDKREQVNWIANLSGRLEITNDDSRVAICILDTGVNNEHPLLQAIIPNRHLDAVEPAWGTNDSHRQGHGTPMAGLAIFGDLTDVFPEAGVVAIPYHIESVKIVETNRPNSPELYGAITQEAVARAEIINPGYKRIVCMAVSTDTVVHLGRPSAWSAAVDQQSFGEAENLNDTTLFLISSGNLPLADRINFPLANYDSSIEDPAQSFNAVTIGSYTLKDQLDWARFPGAALIAQRGEMSPSNTTSVQWLQEWPRKPDLVMEGGNHALHGGGLIDPDSLQLVSTGKGGLGRSWFTAFGDTSGATALASKFAAELYTNYPDYWPETIRGLMIHSADWTPEMLGGHRIEELSPIQKLAILATVGYGVPNFQRARYSANNSLCLVMQRTIKPYKFEDGRVKTDEFHVITLPWPAEVLTELLNTPVKLKVTLSYFIEPNPGNRQYDLAGSYRSHGLRFKMKDTYESNEAFSARISRESRNEVEDYLAEGGEHWVLGNQVRNKGSIHKDIWMGNAAELATRERIAVYSVNGWWKNRAKLGKYDTIARYSLIVSIETPDNGVDIYTPVTIQLPIDL